MPYSKVWWVQVTRWDRGDFLLSVDGRAVECRLLGEVPDDDHLRRSVLGTFAKGIQDTGPSIHAKVLWDGSGVSIASSEDKMFEVYALSDNLTVKMAVGVAGAMADPATVVQEVTVDSDEKPMASDHPDAVLIQFPLFRRDGSWPFRVRDLHQLEEMHPGVDVLEEATKAMRYLGEHPDRRRTERGMLSFLNQWMSKAADRMPNNPKTQITGEPMAAVTTVPNAAGKWDYLGPGGLNLTDLAPGRWLGLPDGADRGALVVKYGPRGTTRDIRINGIDHKSIFRLFEELEPRTRVWAGPGLPEVPIASPVEEVKATIAGVPVTYSVPPTPPMRVGAWLEGLSFYCEGSAEKLRDLRESLDDWLGNPVSDRLAELEAQLRASEEERDRLEELVTRLDTRPPEPPADYTVNVAGTPVDFTSPTKFYRSAGDSKPVEYTAPPGDPNMAEIMKHGMAALGLDPTKMVVPLAPRQVFYELEIERVVPGHSYVVWVGEGWSARFIADLTPIMNDIRQGLAVGLCINERRTWAQPCGPNRLLVAAPVNVVLSVGPGLKCTQTWLTREHIADMFLEIQREEAIQKKMALPEPGTYSDEEVSDIIKENNALLAERKLANEALDRLQVAVDALEKAWDGVNKAKKGVQT